jgi:hypothetical protein
MWVLPFEPGDAGRQPGQFCWPRRAPTVKTVVITVSSAIRNRPRLSGRALSGPCPPIAPAGDVRTAARTGRSVFWWFEKLRTLDGTTQPVGAGK